MAKNQSLGSSRIFENFCATNHEVAKYARQMWHDPFSMSGPDSALWQDDLTRDHLQLAADLFNAWENSIVLVTSELVDLQFSSKGNTNVSVFTESEFEDIASTISNTESASRISEALELDEDLKAEVLTKGSRFMSGTALYNDAEMEFLTGNRNEHDFIRGQSGRCLEWVTDNAKFCGEKAIASADRCVQHQNSGKQLKTDL